MASRVRYARRMPPNRLADMTSDEVAALLARPRPVALVPVGSVEPHGPHLPLATDTILSERAAERGAELLRARGIDAVIAPAVPYGVTRYAAGFKGTVGVDDEALVTILRAVCRGLLDDGFERVCLVNNHLEPAHEAAVRDAAAGAFPGRVVVASPLSRRWARTLSEEFRRGNCHAGRYETSLVLASGVSVRDTYRSLEPIAISLSEGIRSGKTTFAEMGLDRAYTGAPAEATRQEGEALYEKLATMIATEVEESFVEPKSADTSSVYGLRRAAERAAYAFDWASARAAYQELRTAIAERFGALQTADLDALLAVVCRHQGDAEAARRFGEAARRAYQPLGSRYQWKVHRIDQLVLSRLEAVPNPARPPLTIEHANLSVPIPWNEAWLGRSIECDVIIARDTISKLHACVAFSGTWEISDLGSENGTFFGSTWIRKRPLSDGEEYLLGDARIKIRIG